ncbi:phosphatidylserine/phosphatidylglycerophosphate/cardiolipin synthase family protein [Streptosporangiaceae bacterium NEAU-GS5]|nr:phosphatidylserine/phosphatidylglycerophosphate/cardiolipin synthase family protein [Streptosporangiaceae bacterium NEAU-GS5]
MADRIIRTSGATGITAEPIITTVLAGELLAQSPELWLVSPWISDVPGIDNTRGDFDALFLDPVARVYPLSHVLAQLTQTGSQVNVVTRPDDQNRTFVNRFERQANPPRYTTVWNEDVHEKTLCGQGWLLTGSMNFTTRGMRFNDEAVTYHTDLAAAASTRMDFNHRWKGQP